MQVQRFLRGLKQFQLTDAGKGKGHKQDGKGQQLQQDDQPHPQVAAQSGGNTQSVRWRSGLIGSAGRVQRTVS